MSNFGELPCNLVVLQAIFGVWCAVLRMNTQDDTTPTRPLVEVVLPVYNEEEDLPSSVNTLISYLQANAPWLWRILIKIICVPSVWV